MEPQLRARRLSGDHPGVQGKNLISGDVPDQIKRAGAKAKPKPSNAVINSDFTDEVEVITSNPNPVDTGVDSLSAQADTQLTIKIKEKIKTNHVDESLTFMDLTRGIHKAEDIWSLITLVRTSGIPDAAWHWTPYPDRSFPWSDAVVAQLLQLGKDMLACEANLVVDGVPRRYIEPDATKANTLGSSADNLVTTTTIPALAAHPSISSSSTAVHPLSSEALTRHDAQNPSGIPDNKRQLTPEKEKREVAQNRPMTPKG